MAEFDIGFLGGGQLARMSIQAAQRMGLQCISLDPAANTPASQIAISIQGALDDPEAVRRLFERSDRVTLENEFIPGQTIREAGQPEKMLPSVQTLEVIQDKLTQRQALARAGVPSPKAVPIDEALETLDFPMVLKARFGGYDGKGTRYAHTLDEFNTQYPTPNTQSAWLAESFVRFRRELAVMVYVSDTERGCFPTVETVQKDHVCDLVHPADADGREIALAAVEAVQGRGLFGVELFELDSGELLVNEIAPRPHNTGHYTLDWGGVSQFEQHIRLVMGLPCVRPQGRETCMANLLGIEGGGDYRLGLRAAIEGDPEIRVHWYGKAESRPGRKMGHLNAVGEDCVARAQDARRRFYEAWRN